MDGWMDIFAISIFRKKLCAIMRSADIRFLCTLIFFWSAHLLASTKQAHLPAQSYLCSI